VFETLRQGYALGSTLHADSAPEAIAQLTGELGVAEADLARVDLLMVMRVYATVRGQYARRVVSLHRIGLRNGAGLEPVALVEHDQRRDAHKHHEAAELALLAAHLRQAPGASQAELDRRTAFLEELVRTRRRGIAEVRAALAEYRGERVQAQMRGDPTV
jgi:hypothetical protein